MHGEVCLDDIDQKLDHILRHQHTQGRMLRDLVEYLTEVGMTPTQVEELNARMKRHGDVLVSMNKGNNPPIEAVPAAG